MKRAYFLVVGLLLLPACGSKTAAVDDFVKQVAEQQCAWEFRCCTDAEIMTKDGRKFMDQSGCVPYRELALEDELYIQRLAASEGRVRVDSKQAKACLAQMMAQACNPKPGQPPPMPSMTMDACQDVLVGATKPGHQCHFAGECVKGSHCVSDQLTPGSGVCVPYQQENQICNSSSDCDPSADPALYCAQQDFKCHVRGQLGQACAYTVDAAGNPGLPMLLECDEKANLYCDPMTSTCKQLPGAGEPCLTPPPPGVNDSCNPDPTLHLVCRIQPGMTTGTCTGPAKQGEDCTNVPCDKDLFCDRTMMPNTCQPLPTLGQSCTASGQCAMPYFCNFNTGMCDQPAQLGEACDTNGVTCDVGLYCDTTQATPVCAAKLDAGQPCTSSVQCLSNSCSFTTPRVCNPPPPSAVMCVGR